MTQRFGIDVGNTRSKYFRLPGEAWNTGEESLLDWLDRTAACEVTLNDLSRSSAPVEVVSVQPKLSRRLAEELEGRGLAVRLWSSASLPIDNSYEDDRTLGPDRPLAALAARFEFGAPVVVVDAGTALTVDLVTSNGVFAGGAIAPGRGTLGRALGQAGAMLHDVRGEPRSFPACSTDDALNLGVHAAFAGSLKFLVGEALELVPGAPVVVTGGDAQVACAVLADLRALFRPLVLVGLSLLSWGLVGHE